MRSFGDSIRHLALTLLNLLNKNQMLIAEAANFREIEGSQFEELQAKIIGNLSQSLAVYKDQLPRHYKRLPDSQQATQLQYSRKKYNII